MASKITSRSSSQPFAKNRSDDDGGMPVNDGEPGDVRQPNARENFRGNIRLSSISPVETEKRVETRADGRQHSGVLNAREPLHDSAPGGPGSPIETEKRAEKGAYERHHSGEVRDAGGVEMSSMHISVRLRYLSDEYALKPQAVKDSWERTSNHYEAQDVIASNPGHTAEVIERIAFRLTSKSGGFG